MTQQDNSGALHVSTAQEMPLQPSSEKGCINAETGGPLLAAMGASELITDRQGRASTGCLLGHKTFPVLVRREAEGEDVEQKESFVGKAELIEGLFVVACPSDPCCRRWGRRADPRNIQCPV